MNIRLVSWRFDPVDGYGRYATYIAHALEALGVTVSLRTVPGLQHDLDGVPSYMHRHAGVSYDGISLAIMPAGPLNGSGGLQDWPGRWWSLTMFEDSSFPSRWSETINARAERLIVPSEWQHTVATTEGVTIPIDVVYGGTSGYSVLTKSVEREYTFMVLGDRPPRKGTEEAINAFRRAFPSGEPVKLIIKTRDRAKAGGPDFGMLTRIDPRITHWAADVDSVTEMFARADCWVYPSYGDGWGMTPREAVAHGVPAIVPRHSALTVGIDNWATRVIEQHTPTRSDYGREGAVWWRPDVDELASHMRWCYEHQEDARNAALTGRYWLANNQTWLHTAYGIKRLLERHS